MFPFSRREFQDTKASRRFRGDLLLFEIMHKTNVRRKYKESYESTLAILKSYTGIIVMSLGHFDHVQW